jgi:hypothetical protein
MKVFNLRCADGHLFEGWFASEADFLDQNGRSLIGCPLCGNHLVTRMPSAPRLNLSGAAEPEPAANMVAKPAESDLQSMWLQAVQHVLAHTEDVGRRFAEEARRMHYGEIEHRGIRGQATAEERIALTEEGIEVMPLPLPAGLQGPTH